MCKRHKRKVQLFSTQTKMPLQRTGLHVHSCACLSSILLLHFLCLSSFAPHFSVQCFAAVMLPRLAAVRCWPSVRPCMPSPSLPLALFAYYLLVLGHRGMALVPCVCCQHQDDEARDWMAERLLHTASPLPSSPCPPPLVRQKAILILTQHTHSSSLSFTTTRTLSSSTSA